jgi:hypothetical protein
MLASFAEVLLSDPSHWSLVPFSLVLPTIQPIFNAVTALRLQNHPLGPLTPACSNYL